MKIIEPHRKISRDVEIKDINRVKSAIQSMKKICWKKIGRKSGGLAVAHCQVTDKDPLRFFVTRQGNCYINPIIREESVSSKLIINSEEGCLSYPDNKDFVIQRRNEVFITYCVLKNDWSFGIINKLFTNKEAFMFQHEIDHFDGKYIYDESRGE